MDSELTTVAATHDTHHPSDSELKSDSSFEVPALDDNDSTSPGAPSKKRKKSKGKTKDHTPADGKRGYTPRGIFVENVRKLTSEKIPAAPGSDRDWSPERTGSFLSQEGGGQRERRTRDLEEGTRGAGEGHIGGEEEEEQYTSDDLEDRPPTGCVGFLQTRQFLRLSLLTWLKILFLLVVVTTFVVLIVLVPVKEVLVSISDWVKQQGPVGPIVYTLFLFVAILLCLPTTAIELIAGFSFGFWIALPVSYVGKNGGCIAAFLLGRLLGRRSVKKLVRRFKVLRMFERVMAKNAVKMVFLIRLAYMPIALKNYGLSLFAVRRRLFILATLLCTIPECALFAYFGSSAGDIVDLLDGKYSGGPLGIATLAIGVVVALVVLFLIIYYTRKEWNKVTEEIEAEGQRRRERSGRHQQAADAAAGGATAETRLPVMTSPATVATVEESLAPLVAPGTNSPDQ